MLWHFSIFLASSKFITTTTTTMLWFDLLLFRFGGRQVDASEDDGLINHALVRDHDEDAARLEQFGAELEAD